MRKVTVLGKIDDPVLKEGDGESVIIHIEPFLFVPILGKRKRGLGDTVVDLAVFRIDPPVA